MGATVAASAKIPSVATRLNSSAFQLAVRRGPSPRRLRSQAPATAYQAAQAVSFRLKRLLATNCSLNTAASEARRCKHH